MNEGNQPPIEIYYEPEEVSSYSQMGGQQQKKEARRGFNNPVFPNDSLTTCSGFINEVRSHIKNDDTLYFVRVGLIQGSRKNERDEWEGDFTNCDLLVGPTLKKWAEQMMQFKELFTGIRVNFVIRNLKFTPGIYEGKPVLNSRGILEVIEIGHIDRNLHEK